RDACRHRRRARDQSRDSRRSLMTTRSFVVPVLAGVLLPACGAKPVAPTPARPAQALVALLPDADTGKTGRALVTSPEGTADLAAESAPTLEQAHRDPGRR